MGNTGLKVSQLAIGTWHLPGSGTMNNGVENVDINLSEKIMHSAYDKGINFFDTANIYHGRVENNEEHIECTGNSESILGNAFAGYERESLVISTKVRGPMGKFPNGEGLSRKHIMWQVRESLKRLKTDYVDLYQFHWSDNETPLEETARAMSHIVDLDLARYIGMSNVNYGDIDRLFNIAKSMNLNRYSTIQEPYNLLNREIEADKIRAAQKYNLCLLAYVPLAQGILTGKYLDGKSTSGTRLSYYPELKKEIENTYEAVRKLEEFAREKDATPSQVAIKWIIEKGRQLNITIIPLLGITKIEHLEDNIKALELNLDSSDIGYLDEINKFVD